MFFCLLANPFAISFFILSFSTYIILLIAPLAFSLTPEAKTSHTNPYFLPGSAFYQKNLYEKYSLD
jgi:hypothetical protein